MSASALRFTMVELRCMSSLMTGDFAWTLRVFGARASSLQLLVRVVDAQRWRTPAAKFRSQWQTSKNLTRAGPGCGNNYRSVIHRAKALRLPASSAVSLTFGTNFAAACGQPTPLRHANHTRSQSQESVGTSKSTKSFWKRLTSALYFVVSEVARCPILGRPV